MPRFWFFNESYDCCIKVSKLVSTSATSSILSAVVTVHQYTKYTMLVVAHFNIEVS